MHFLSGMQNKGRFQKSYKSWNQSYKKERNLSLHLLLHYSKIRDLCTTSC